MRRRRKRKRQGDAEKTQGEENKLCIPYESLRIYGALKYFRIKSDALTYLSSHADDSSVKTDINLVIFYNFFFSPWTSLHVGIRWKKNPLLYEIILNSQLFFLIHINSM